MKEIPIEKIIERPVENIIKIPVVKKSAPKKNYIRREIPKIIENIKRNEIPNYIYEDEIVENIIKNQIFIEKKIPPKLNEQTMEKYKKTHQPKIVYVDNIIEKEKIIEEVVEVPKEKVIEIPV